MSQIPDTISRLRAANPNPTRAELVEGPTAQATLERILQDRSVGNAEPRRRMRLRLPRSGLGVGLVVLVLGGGAAVAATNPFGWWSANPSNARYGLNPTARVQTPTAQSIRCIAAPGHGIVCSPGGSGQRYFRVDTIRLTAPNAFFTRSYLVKAMAAAQARHQVSAAAAARFRHDLAQVPDSFFVEFRRASHYGTYGGGNNEVPPVGIPEILACGQAGSALSCRNLNGDRAVPLGAGVYEALPGPGWRRNPHPGQDYALPPGIHFTRAEYRVLMDIALTGRATHRTPSAGPSHATRAR